MTIGEEHAKKPDAWNNISQGQLDYYKCICI